MHADRRTRDTYTSTGRTALHARRSHRAARLDCADARVRSHGRYGLGQTYEILTMYFYALFYYRKATALRPYDARMWCAMAGCYKLLQRKPEAIRCYQRAESNHDREGIAYTELARLFREEGDQTQAAHYFRQARAACLGAACLGAACPPGPRLPAPQRRLSDCRSHHTSLVPTPRSCHANAPTDAQAARAPRNLRPRDARGSALPGKLLQGHGGAPRGAAILHVQRTAEPLAPPRPNPWLRRSRPTNLLLPPCGWAGVS